MSNLEPVLGSDDTIRRNFFKLEPIFDQLRALITSAFGGSGGGTGTGTGPAQARVRNSANISIITLGTPQFLTFDTERWDTGDFHSTSVNTSRLTAPTAGLYDIGACVEFASNATGSRQVALVVNGSAFIAIVEVPAVSGRGTVLEVGTQYQLAATDYVEVRVRQDGASPLNVTAATNYSPEFWIVRLGSQA